MKMLAVVLAVCLTACSSAPQKPPTPFKPGAATTTPLGCEKGKQEGVEC